MDDIHETITRLADEERTLRASGDHGDEQRSRLRAVEHQLDQAWDLLRQREALREAGEDPAAAEPRPVAEVETYLQ